MSIFNIPHKEPKFKVGDLVKLIGRNSPDMVVVEREDFRYSVLWLDSNLQPQLLEDIQEDCLV